MVISMSITRYKYRVVSCDDFVHLYVVVMCTYITYCKVHENANKVCWPGSVMGSRHLNNEEQTSGKFSLRCKTVHPRKYIWRRRFQNDGHFVQTECATLINYRHSLGTLSGVDQIFPRSKAKGYHIRLHGYLYIEARNVWINNSDKTTAILFANLFPVLPMTDNQPKWRTNAFVFIYNISIIQWVPMWYWEMCEKSKH